MSSFYKLFQSVTEMLVTKQPRPLGRWNLHHNQFMKTDLANVDNCGDRLCKLPQSVKTITIKKSIQPRIDTLKGAAYWG